MEHTKTEKMDMLHGPIWNKIIQYALPVAATGILEQLFNASDLAVVGNFTGEAKTVAVAAMYRRGYDCHSSGSPSDPVDRKNVAGIV